MKRTVALTRDYAASWLILAGWAAVLGLDAARADETVDFARDIRPILSNSCYACHGPDREGQHNDLRLDSRSTAIASAIVPGQADASLLIERVSSTDPETKMPPVDSRREPLSAPQIELLRRWINQGAVYTDHWAYAAPRRSPLPEVHRTDWPVNAIDRFVLAQNETRNVSQAPTADRRTLIRRLYFDLLGLPPEAERVRRFQADESAEAYERLVDEVLESEHFGERMAIVWLDLVRYADTCGYHGDQHRSVDAYRDYVINSFNSNKPFDRFTVEQLAGDLLPEPSQEQLIATGFNRLLQTTEEGGAQPQEYRAIYDADRVRNVSGVWLGTTLGCAQCHDHKFDPFTSGDFYRFAAFFADVEEVAVGRQSENLELPTDEQRRQLEELDQQIAALQSAAAADAGKRGESDKPSDAGQKQDAAKPAGTAEQTALKELEQQRDKLRQQLRRTLITHAVEPRMTRILRRGNWLDTSGAVVQPAIPALFGPVGPGDGRATRLDLARWLMSADNPLTARVFVNHLWRIMFGQGLVRTPEDFGSQGQFPTHRELLDWLAVEFRESGWDVKHMLRLIAISRTYRQSSVANELLRQQDPYNLWLARQSRFRLDAEMVRDNALAVSGLLVRQVGGRSVRPYQPAGYWDQLNFPKRTYEPDRDDQQYRRGLYTFWCRTFLHPSLLAFDAPTREECTAKRPRSNTPLQALVLLNDPSYVEAARALGQRILELGGQTVDDKLAWACFETLSREPTDDERHVLGEVYRQQRQRYAADVPAARQLIQVGQWRDAELSEDQATELAAWTTVSRVLLNLHETVTRS